MNKIMLAGAVITALLMPYHILAQTKSGPLRFGNPKGYVFDVEFVNSSMLAIAESNTIKVFQISDQSFVYELSGGHSDVILSIDVSPDSSKLVSGGRDGKICLWDINKQQLIKSYSYHNGVVTSVKFGLDNSTILSGGTDDQLILYDFAKDSVAFRFVGHKDDILCVGLHPDGNLAASSSADSSIKIWSIQSGEQIGEITDLKGWQRDIAFTSDGGRLLSCGDDRRVSTWDVHDAKRIAFIKEIKIGGDWILSQDLYDNGKTVVSGGIDGVVRINSLARYKHSLGKPITRVIFKPNERGKLKVIAATLGAGVFLIDAANMQVGHHSGVF